jgi:hypothetical protein
MPGPSAADKKRAKMRAKLDAKRAEEEAKREKTAEELEAEAVAEAERAKLLADRISEIQTDATAREEKDRTWDANAKAFRGAVSDETKLEAIKVARQVHMVTEGNMSPAESARLQALVGSGKNQNMKTFVHQEGVTATISEDVDARTAVVISHCKDCNYTLSEYCAKLFVQDCENVSVTVNGKVLTETVEIHQCAGVRLTINTRIGTVQADQSSNCIIEFASREVFGNGLQPCFPSHAKYVISFISRHDLCLLWRRNNDAERSRVWK